MITIPPKLTHIRPTERSANWDRPDWLNALRDAVDALNTEALTYSDVNYKVYRAYIHRLKDRITVNILNKTDSNYLTGTNGAEIAWTLSAPGTNLYYGNLAGAFNPLTTFISVSGWYTSTLGSGTPSVIAYVVDTGLINMGTPFANSNLDCHIYIEIKVKQGIPTSGGIMSPAVVDVYANDADMISVLFNQSMMSTLDANLIDAFTYGVNGTFDSCNLCATNDHILELVPTESLKYDPTLLDLTYDRSVLMYSAYNRPIAAFVEEVINRMPIPTVLPISAETTTTGVTIKITFDLAISDVIEATLDDAITIAGKTVDTIARDHDDTTMLLISVTVPFASGDVITVSFDATVNLYSAYGTLIPAFSNLAVTNNVPA